MSLPVTTGKGRGDEGTGRAPTGQDPSPTNGKELVISTHSQLDRLKAAIASIETKEDLVHALGMTKAAEAYAQVQKSIELEKAVLDIRAWTERRAGEVTADEGLTKIAKELGVQTQIVHRWRDLASAPREIFCDALATSHDIYEVARRVTTKMLREIEVGIERMPEPSSRWRVSYEGADGRRHTHWLSANLSLAYVRDERRRGIREARAIRRSQAARLRAPDAKNLEECYSTVRWVLEALDGGMGDFPSEVRTLVEEAMHGLYRAEDNLILAYKTIRLIHKHNDKAKS